VFDSLALEELALSIREHGIIQPLIVSEQSNGNYELIAGERRWRAAQQAGLTTVPVLVRETTPQQLLELALIENVQRADLNALEEAHAYQALKDEFGLSDEQIAKRVGKNNRVTIANTRRLLKLPQTAKEALMAGTLSAGHGRALLRLEQAEQQEVLLHAVLQNDLSVRDTERIAERAMVIGDLALAMAEIRGTASDAGLSDVAPKKKAEASKKQEAPSNTADDIEVKRSLEELLGTPVHFQRTERDLRITITFHTEEKLQEFFDLLQH
jgi:ParB family chromosome partitioning protein